MKILVSIPCLYGSAHTKEAIDSVIKPNVDLLLIDNGAEPDVKRVLDRYPTALIIRNKENIYVNPAWQQAISYFLMNPQYSHLILMNSDLIMQKDWSEVCFKRWENNPDEILIPNMTQDKFFNFPVHPGMSEVQRVYEGTPGVFITLSRKQAEIINPLPTEIKVWFGDNWIYEILRGLDYKTVIPENLWSYHYWSQTVQRVPGISELIEKDKVQWESIKHKINEKIELYRAK